MMIQNVALLRAIKFTFRREEEKIAPEKHQPIKYTVAYQSIKVDSQNNYKRIER